MQADGERVGQHGLLVAHGVRDGDELVFMCRQQRGEPPGDRPAVARMHAGRKPTVAEALAHEVVPGLAGGTGRVDTARPAPQPGVQRHPLAHPALPHARSHPLHHSHHFVPGHGGEGDQRGQRVVEVGIQEDHLGVAAADAAQGGADHRPIVTEQLRLRNVAQARRAQRRDVRARRQLPHHLGIGQARHLVLENERFHRLQHPLSLPAPPLGPNGTVGCHARRVNRSSGTGTQ